MLGTVLEGRYELESLIAEGGMGAVYRARDRRLDRAVAVKLLGIRGDPLTRARFAREARALAKLSHPNINAIFDAGDQDDRPYLVLELVDGLRLSRFQRAPYPVVLDLTRQALRALAYAHAQGVVHRDLKPANMLVVQEAGAAAGWLLKILDFGVAALARGSRITDQNEVTGTPAYLAPEQATGDTVDGRADLYSLGAVLYELLTGRPPFVHDHPVTVMFHHVNVAPAPPGSLRHGVPASVDRFVLKLLAKDPGDRYASAADALLDVEQMRLEPAAAEERPPELASPAAEQGAVDAHPVDRRATSPSPPFQGRQGELSTLLAVLEDTVDGRPRVAVVKGPEGVGTSRLLIELARSAGATGASVYAVSCGVRGRARPYAALASLLRAYVRSTSVAETRYVLGALSDAVEPFLLDDPGSEPSPPAVDAGRVARAVALLFHDAAPGPVVLVVDDASLLDAESARVLIYVAARAVVPPEGRLPVRRLLLVFGLRDAAPSEGTEWGEVVAALGRLGCARELALGPLDDPHLRAIATSAAAPEIDERWASEIARLSAGIPGRVTDLLRLLRESGVVVDSDRGWRPAAGATPPSSLDELVRARLASLSAGAVATLSHVAVLFPSIDGATVTGMRAADQVPDSEVRRHLDEAVAAGVLAARRATADSLDRYDFVHAVVRDALYQGLNSMRRRRLHRRAADILAAQGLQSSVSAALLAHLQALGDTSAIGACAATAARDALAGGDPREAARLYRLAIDGASGESGREHSAALLHDLAAVERSLGRYRSARACLARLAKIAEHRSTWGAAALARTESAETAACAHAPEAIESDARLALASGMQVGQPALIKRALSCLALRQSLGGDWAEAMRTLRLADRTELEAGIRDRQASPIGHYAAALAMHQANRLLDGLAHGLAAWRGSLLESGCHGLAAHALLAVARTLIDLGDAPAAMARLVRGAAELPSGAGPHAQGVIWLGMAEARAALRDWDGAERDAAAALAAATGPDARAAAAAVLVGCLVRRESLDAAGSLLERQARWAGELGPDWYNSASVHVSVAEGCARLGRNAAATAELDRAERYADATQQTRAGLLGKLARAELGAASGDLEPAREAAIAARGEALRHADPMLAIRARALAARLAVRLDLSDPDEHPATQFAIAATDAAHVGDEALAREIDQERDELLGEQPQRPPETASGVVGVVRSLKEGLVATHDRDWARAQRALEQAMRMGTSAGGCLAATCRLYSATMLMAASSPRLGEAERLLYEARRLFGSERLHDEVDEVDVLLLKLGRRSASSVAHAESGGVL